MTWWEIANSLTADSSDMNDNFSELAAGSITPRSSAGASFVATNSVHDLGTTTARYNTVYFDNAHCSSITKEDSIWSLEAQITLSSTASSIEITGLNGDAAEEYMIITRILGDLVTGGERVEMIINGDSDLNYGYQWVEGYGAAATAARAIETDHISYLGMFGFNTNTAAFSRCLCNIKTGNTRVFNIICCGGMHTSYSHIVSMISSTWRNTSDTMTSFRIYGEYGSDLRTNSVVQVWSR